MIRRMVTVWGVVLGLMVALTGPNVLVANMKVYMTEGCSVRGSGLMLWLS
jgi:hypothetical protein